MIVLDVNILLYAYAEPVDAPFRNVARRHLETIFSQTESVAIPIQCIYSFLRLSTQPILSKRKVTLQRSLDTVDEWLSLPHVRILYPGEQHWAIVKQLATEIQATGKLLPDVTIAALALEYGAVVHSNDRDFARFPGVRWHNPLV